MYNALDLKVLIKRLELELIDIILINLSYLTNYVLLKTSPH